MSDIVPYLVNAAVVVIVALSFPLAERIPPFGELVRWMDTFAYRLQSTRAALPEPSDVAIVEIDRNILDAGAARLAPIDRGTLSALLRAIGERNPDVIAVDIDIRAPLEAAFDAKETGIEITRSYRETLALEDAELAGTINALAGRGVRIVLGATPPYDIPSMIGIDLSSPNIALGDARAFVDTVDGVLYSFPAALGTSDATAVAVETPRPSFAFATWALASGATGIEARAPDAPARLSAAIRDDWAALRAKAPPLINWRRLDPRPGAVALERISASRILKGESTPDLSGRTVILGRVDFVSAPYEERKDMVPTPYRGLEAAGVHMQALFVDNLVTRSWLERSGFWQAFLFSCALSVLVGSGLILGAQYAQEFSPTQTSPYWISVLRDPFLSFFLAMIAVSITGFLANWFFLQKGLYMLSITLLPISAAFEALLYNAWALRS